MVYGCDSYESSNVSSSKMTKPTPASKSAAPPSSSTKIFLSNLPRFQSNSIISKFLKPKLLSLLCDFVEFVRDTFGLKITFKYLKFNYCSMGKTTGTATFTLFPALEHSDEVAIPTPRLQNNISNSLDLVQKLDDFINSSSSSPLFPNSIITVSLQTFSRLDSGFPFLSAEKRLLLCLDETSSFSLTPWYAAQDMADASLAILKVIDKAAPHHRHHLEHPVCVDMTAGGGANFISFTRCAYFAKTIGLESDNDRCRDLAHNMVLAIDDSCDTEFQTLSVDCIDWFHNYSSILSNPPLDLVFIDPPFGGLCYTSHAFTETLQDYPLGTEYLSTLICKSFCLSGKVKVCAIKVPSIFNPLPLFTRLTAPSPLSSTENTTASSFSWTIDAQYGLENRPHPFTLKFGEKLSLLLIAYPPFATNSTLDTLIKSLLQFDKDRASIFHPKFFDWQAQSLISLKRWKFKSL